jgi:hypothetical protein
MKYRKAASFELFNRIKAAKDFIGLKSFKVGPAEVPAHDMVPQCVMVFGEDRPIKKSARSANGFPQDRVAELFFDIIDVPSSDLETKIKEVRNKVMSDTHPVKDELGNVVVSCFISESMFVGPIPFGVPGLSAIRLVLELVYSDDGK